MKRIFSDYAYGEGPRAGCWWDETCTQVERPAFGGSARCDVAVIGAGFTGLTAALRLAEAGADVAVLDAHYPGWGASGRNGGFCCLGGGRANDAALDARFGRDERLAYRAAEKAAVALVGDFLDRHGIDADRHSRGETELAHRPKDMDDLRRRADTIEENYGTAPTLHEPGSLAGLGMDGPFHGGLTVPVGFGLNPRKYVTALARAAESAGAAIFDHSPVSHIERGPSGFILRTASGTLNADQVVIATNGYSSEDMPPWLAGRFMPGQSNALVTRPLTDAELDAAGWTSDQMAYDTRHLLHYFRLLPDRRFLFGMRGGLLTGAAAEARSQGALRRHFARMFPAWSHVETPHCWSGMVCLARNMLPFAGQVPGHPGLWAGLCYHGNGVAMGSFSGALLAELMLGRQPALHPAAMRQPLARFPLGSLRRAIMPGVYAGLALADL